MRSAGDPIRFEFRGEWLTATEIAARCGKPVSTVRWRLNRKWPPDEVLHRPVRGGWVTPKGRGLTLWGEPVSQKELAQLAGVSPPMMSRRLNKMGMTPEQAVQAGNYRTGKF